MNEKLLRPYSWEETEPRIYEMWEKNDYFKPKESDGKNGFFSILMPPTNANGSLHAGHALVLAIEDALVRFKRMTGNETLWVPGLDHAGFETQVVYEKKLEKDGRSRFDIPPKQLYEEIFEFTKTNSENIRSQVRKMGASCDWSREKFTLDNDVVETVYTTFKKLFDDGLLYRGKRVVNWCPKHQTSFSDLEIDDVEKMDKLYYLKYGPFTIATARPETKFGDKYVVMHPDDARYKKYIDGEQIELEWINGPITATIVKDNAIDMSFGTGVMTITPWHDTTDFAIAERHNLEKVQIIDERGRLLPVAGEFSGMKIVEAREKIIEKMKSKGLVEKIDNQYKHVIKTCYKCGTTIEPQIKSQWFIKMKPLADEALKRIEAEEIEYIPAHYKKITIHWLQNIMDWNISRQIVWGISIPAKICEKCDVGLVDLENKIENCPNCKQKMVKDPDTFDTWFSSGQWPFVALNYPAGNDFEKFYPTSVMETAGEIIFFWVARMIMLSLYVTGKIPFKTVYLHGLVLDAKGQKMSKSKGNVINPLDLTAKFGTDALRIALLVGNTPGTSLAFSEDKIKGYKHFANKIWNASRFVISNCENFNVKERPKLTERNEEQIGDLYKVLEDITEDLNKFRFHLATEKIYHYFWHTFADIIIEESKEKILNGTEEEKNSAKYTLFQILEKTLIALHPFMPFITEEIWSMLPDREQMLIATNWPVQLK